MAQTHWFLPIKRTSSPVGLELDCSSSCIRISTVLFLSYKNISRRTSSLVITLQRSSANGFLNFWTAILISSLIRNLTQLRVEHCIDTGDCQPIGSTLRLSHSGQTSACERRLISSQVEDIVERT